MWNLSDIRFFFLLTSFVTYINYNAKLDMNKN